MGDPYQYENLMEGPAKWFIFNDGISLLCTELSLVCSSEGKK